MSCIEQMKYKLYLERTSFKEAREFIEKNSEEVYYVEPGYRIFKDYYIIGVPPVALGIRGNEVLFTYVKPCWLSQKVKATLNAAHTHIFHGVMHQEPSHHAN